MTEFATCSHRICRIYYNLDIIRNLNTKQNVLIVKDAHFQLDNCKNIERLSTEWKNYTNSSKTYGISKANNV